MVWSVTSTTGFVVIHSFTHAYVRACYSQKDKVNVFRDAGRYAAIADARAGIAEAEAKLRAERAEIRRRLHAPALDYVSVSGKDYLVEVKSALVKEVPKDWVRISAYVPFP